MKGQTAASSYKTAVLANGVRVLVPPFIAAGEMIVDKTDEITYVKPRGLMQHSALINVMVAAARRPRAR